MASSSVSGASVPCKKRKSSDASSGLDSETGRLLTSLGSVGSGLADEGTSGLGPTATDADTAELPKAVGDLEGPNFIVHPALPQNHHFHHHGEENSSHTSSRGSRHLPHKKRKMSYESYDSGMGDSALGLASASVDSGILPKLPDVNSVATKESGGSDNAHLHPPGVSALEHLDALGDHAAAGMPAAPKTAPAALKQPPSEDTHEQAEDSHSHSVAGKHEEHPGDEDHDDHASSETFTSSGHRLLMEAFMMSSGGLDSSGRKRLESWGGMSDLSTNLGHDSSANAAAAIAASALHHTGIIDDVTAAANFCGNSVDSDVTDDHGKHGIDEDHNMPMPRSRKESSTSFSDSTFAVPPSLDGIEISTDLQKFVAAAVASVGDQLAELAGAVESAAMGVDLDSLQYECPPRLDSEASSLAAPVVPSPVLEDASKAEKCSTEQVLTHDHADTAKHVEAAATAAAISVDYDAVAAAVDAAHAATGALDLSAIGETSNPMRVPPSGGSSISSGAGKTKGKRKLPVHNNNRMSCAKPTIPKYADIPKSTMTEKELEEMRERARKAAGYVPPSETSSHPTTPIKRALPPLKKRAKRMTPEPPTKPLSHVTPRISNVSRKLPEAVPSRVVSATEATPQNSGAAADPVTSGSTKPAKGQSTQKWNMMFDCLLQFIEERKEEETKGASKEEIDKWVWDGNVPTTYKTKDGKALGRWVNNQRSAKSKGNLKDERENRLVDAGLKWSVLASNSWNEMLEELRIYIKEYVSLNF
jgi:hypothetical protein